MVPLNSHKSQKGVSTSINDLMTTCKNDSVLPCLPGKPCLSIFHDETVGLQQATIAWICPPSQDAIVAKKG